MDNFDALVNEERERQDTKWGEQNHLPYFWLVILMEEIGELSKAILENDEQFRHPDRDIENELIQSAAVLKAMYESGVRNGWIST